MQLLPKSAAAFAPRAAPNIVLNTRVEPWLTQAIKRVAKVKRTLNNPQQHHRVLTELLGGTAAIWNLASIVLPKAPKADLTQYDDDPLMEAMHNYDMIHIQAYVVHIDMVSQHEVAFKLTSETIEALIDYHKDIFCVDAAASIFDWPEKDAQVKKLQEEFKQAVNRFVFRTHMRALEGLEEDGAGELLEGRSEVVKGAVTQLFAPLLPPPPRIVDIVHPTSTFANNGLVAGWWQPTGFLAHSQPTSFEPWRVLPSTPSPTSTTCSDAQVRQSWPTASMALDLTQLPSPTPSYTQPVYTSAASLYSSPQTLCAVPPILYPSQLPQSCASMATGSIDSFGYGYNAFAAPQYATTM